MEPNNDQASRWQINEVLRWLCVLPAAFLGGMLARFILRIVFQIARFGGWDTVGHSSIAEWFFVFLSYVPGPLAFVVGGAMTSPRYQRTTAVGLAVFGILLSLTIHLVGQYLAGNHIGPINFFHFSAESAGCFGGATCIFYRNWKKPPTEAVA